MTYIFAPQLVCWGALGCVWVPVCLVKGLSKPHCSGMCVPGALKGETPKGRSRAGGMAPVPHVWGCAGPLLPGACVSPSIRVTSLSWLSQGLMALPMA